MNQADSALGRLLYDAGLLQFGWFEHGDTVQPVAVHLEMIASFPDILARCVDVAVKYLDAAACDRLLGSPDAIPWATALSLASGIPLVYSRGTAEAAPVDLVGAYDGGHPVLLMANTIGVGRDPGLLVSKARRVGLEVHTLLAVLEVRAAPPTEGVQTITLLRLEDMVRQLSTDGRLPEGHAQAVLDWIAAPLS